MSVPFGFSIGDFIAVGALAYQIAQALSETRGAVSDYSSLIELLRSLSGSLQTVSDFISSLSMRAAVKPDIALINGINYHVKCCQRLLCQFTVNITSYSNSFDTLRDWLLIYSLGLQLDSKKYTESLFNGKGRYLQKEIRKIKWSLYKADDAHKLEQRLQGHADAFQVYLVAIGM